MSTVAIAVVALCLLLAWCALIDAMRAVAIAEACPCQRFPLRAVRSDVSPLVTSSRTDEAAITALQTDCPHSGTSH